MAFDKTVILDFKAKMGELTRNLKKVKKQTDDITGKKGDRFSQMFKKAGTALKGLVAVWVGAKLIQGIARLTTQSLQLAAAFEQTVVSFQTLTGSAEKSKELIKELTEFSVKTPFTPEQVIQSAQTLLSFGVQAEEITGTLGNLGEAAAATGTDLNELSFIFGKVQVKGKLLQEEANQFLERGIPLYEILGTSLGKSNAELKQMQADGKITGEVLAKAFADAAGEGGKFQGALEAQSRTLAGLVSTLQGKFGDALRNVGLLLAPFAKEVLKSINDVFGDEEGGLNKTLEDLANSDAPLRLAARWAQAGKVMDITFGVLSNQVQLFFSGVRGGIGLLTKLEGEFLVMLGNLTGIQSLITTGAEHAVKGQDRFNKEVALTAELEQKIADIRSETPEDVFERTLAELREQKEADEKFLRIKKQQKDLGDETDETKDKIVAQAGSIAKLTAELGKLEKQLISTADRGDQESLIKKIGLKKEEIDEATRSLERLQFTFVNLQAGILEALPTIGGDALRSLGLSGRLAPTDEARAASQKALEEQIQQGHINRMILARLTIEDEEELNKTLLTMSLELERDVLKARLIALERVGEGASKAADDIRLGLLEIKAELKAAGADDEDPLGFSTAVEAGASILDIAAHVYNQVAALQLAALDKMIDKQKSAVDKAKEAAERGNAEQLELEEERLKELESIREESARRQQQIASIQIASAQAVAIASAIEAIAAGGNPIAIALNVAAIIGGIITATTAIKSAFGDIQSFAEGVDKLGVSGKGVDGKGGRPIIAHKGERIMTAGQNALLPSGLKNEDIPGLVSMGLKYKNGDRLAIDGKYVKDTASGAQDLQAIAQELRYQNQLLERIGAANGVTEKGVYRAFLNASQDMDRINALL